MEWQLRVAAGQPLPKRQDELQIIGHAIEARICAENPDNGFLPATGTLHVYRKPTCSSFAISDVRVDDGVREGDAISPFYDSMIAKLIVHGDTREQALARLDAAQTQIVGLSSNVQFLRHVVKSEAFAQAKLDTALIEREKAVLFQQTAVPTPLAVAIAVAQQLQAEQALETADPFSHRDGWHSHGTVHRSFTFVQDSATIQAVLTYGRHGALQLQVGNVAAPLHWQPQGDGLLVEFAGARSTAQVHVTGEARHIFTPRGAAVLQLQDPLAHAGAGHSEGGRLTAPMPGKLVSFAVKAGDAVTKGQALAVMEAMKMEHTIAAPADGVVQELLYAPGDQVTEGAELIRIEANA